MAGIGTVPTTSYLAPTTNSFLPKTGMDPGTALAISAGSSAISGGLGASGSKKAADKASAAAEAQAKAVQAAARETPFLGFGAESLAKKHDAFVGGPLDRLKAFEDTKMAGALAFSPNTMARERLRLAQEMAALKQQQSGGSFGLDPMNRFV